MANNDPVILSEEPSSVRININDPNKSKKNTGGQMVKRQQKIPWYDRVIGAFCGQDVNHENLLEHVVKNWAVPTGQRMLNNGIQSGLKRASDATQMMIFGRVVNSQNGPVDYSSYSQQSNIPAPGIYQVTQAVDVFAFRDRSKAEECLAYLKGRIATYQSVGVLDYFEWLNDKLGAGISLDYNMADRGWKDLSNVTVKPDPNGYIIDFPRPVFLKRG